MTGEVNAKEKTHHGAGLVLRGAHEAIENALPHAESEPVHRTVVQGQHGDPLGPGLLEEVMHRRRGL